MPFQLSKQQLMYGPMQIESRIDQDQNISKDLTLCGTNRARTSCAETLFALPVGSVFLYVESIYIQAGEEAHVCLQLKKVVLAMGDRLIYRDTFVEALAELTGGSTPPGSPLPVAAPVAAPALAATVQNLPALAERLRRLREQAEQLARELEALEKEAQKKKK